MDNQVSANRYRLLTAACRHCRATLRLGYCDVCPMTERRRLARLGEAWTDEPARGNAEGDPAVPRRSPADKQF